MTEINIAKRSIYCITEQKNVFYLSSTPLTTCPNNVAHSVQGGIGYEDVLGIKYDTGTTFKAGLYNAVYANANTGLKNIILPKIPIGGTDLIYWVGATNNSVNNVILSTTSPDTFSSGGSSISYNVNLSGTGPQVYVKSDRNTNSWVINRIAPHDQFSLDIQDKRGNPSIILQNMGDTLVTTPTGLQALPSGPTGYILTVGGTGIVGGLGWSNPSATFLLSYRWVFITTDYTFTNALTFDGAGRILSTNAGWNNLPGATITVGAEFEAGTYRIAISGLNKSTTNNTNPAYQVLVTGGTRLLLSITNTPNNNAFFTNTRLNATAQLTAGAKTFTLQVGGVGTGSITFGDVHFEIFRVQ